MTDNTYILPPSAARDKWADASGAANPRPRAGEVVTGRQALIDQALQSRAQLLGKLNLGARKRLRELAQAIGEPDALGLE